MDGMKYKSQLLKEVQKEQITQKVYTSLDELYDECIINKNQSSKDKTSINYHCAKVELVEEVSKVIDDVQNYWSQFGFLDKTLDYNTIVNNIIKYVSIEQQEEEQDQEQDQSYINYDDGDDFYLQK